MVQRTGGWVRVVGVGCQSTHEVVTVRAVEGARESRRCMRFTWGGRGQQHTDHSLPCHQTTTSSTWRTCRLGRPWRCVPCW